ncbi:MAG: MFS transporter [Acidimicrobiales bacterium]|nr:MFS transporter [Acidimicrobiales bacterium]MCB9393939.1 MFS transporter [Acidimicrobiaceae bacterium]
MRARGGIWDRLTVTFALSFCLLVAGLSVGIVLGELRDQLGISGIVAAAHGSAFGVGMLVLGAFGSGFVGRLGRPRAFWGACATITAGLMLLCAGQVWPVTLLGSSLAGVACSMLVLLMPGIIADHHGERRGAAFAAVNGVPGLAGITFSLVVGAVIAAGGSWRWPYALITLAFAAGVLVAGRGQSIPVSVSEPVDVLPLFRRADVRVPWLHIVHAVLVEFPVGIWSVAYLKEVGGASSGAAAALGSIWGLFMFLGRMQLPRLVRRFGEHTRSLSFALCAAGTLLMWSGPGLWARVAGLTVVALGAGPLYPLAVERLYERGGADTVSLGFVTALASGAAVTVGPLMLGVLADAVGLRHALLFVPVLAALGMYTARRDMASPQPTADALASV